MEEHNLLQSFLEHRDERGIHFYATDRVEWIRWDGVFAALDAMNLPTDANEKIIEAMSNYNAKNEFVAVKLAKTGLSIEVFKASELR